MMVRVILLVTAGVALGQDWAGTWKGSLSNFPVREGAKAVEVTLEIGAFPKAEGVCSTWRTTYLEGGKVRQVKDYKLCRGNGADDLYIDEGGLKLAARWIGDVLVSPFKYDNVLLITTTRLRGDVLEEEILTVEDQPAVKGALPLHAKGIQRLILKRAGP